MYRLCLVVLLGVWHASAQLTTPAPGSAVDCNAVGIQNCGKCNLPGMTCAICAHGFVLAADYKSCIACDSNCIDCVLDSTGKIGMCQLCAPGYEVKSDGTCGQCGTYCATCTFTDAAETQTDCLACFPTSALVLYPYLLGSYSKQCQDCTQVTAGCSSCSEAADKTLSCTGCQPGYVAVTNAGVKTCTACPSRCLSCSIPKGAVAPTTCATCQTNYVANSATTVTNTFSACLYCDPTKCSKCSTTAVSAYPYIAQCSTCQKGYYLDSNKMCIACPAGCATCTSSTACQSCVSIGFFFDSANSKCTPCSYGCNTCTISANVETCTACSAGYGLQSNGASCQECPPYCTACSDPATCTDCVDISVVYPIEYQLVVDVDGTFCMLCPDNCVTCDDVGTYEAVCTECKPGYTAGTDANGDSFCFRCPSHCTTCTVDQNTYQTTCTLCELDTTTGLDYYLNAAGTCSSCGAGCNDCTGTNNACNDCKDGYLFDSATPKCSPCTDSKCKTCDPVGTCSVCVDGYYLDGTTCKPCVTGCKCAPATPTTCDSCIGAPYYVLNTGNTACLKCDSNCVTCGLDAVCTACTDEYRPDTDSSASVEGTKCIKCDANCDLSVSTQCSTSGTKPVCSKCLPGYYVNSQDGCTRCPTTGCSTCDVSNICTGCLPGYTSNNAPTGSITCLANPTGCAVGMLDPAFPSNNVVTCSQCADGYGSNLKTSGVCDPCPAYCKTCTADPVTGIQVCSQCDNGYAENKFACSECPVGCTSCRNVNGAMFCTQCSPLGYYLDSKNGVCIACTLCSSCTANGCNAGTCDDGYGLASDQTCTDCATLTTVSGCSNCTDADSTGMAMCLDCDNGQVLDGWGANCVDASPLGDCAMPEFRPYECTPGSCNSPFEWVTDGPGRGQCGLHCAVCGDLSRGLFLAECQNANNNYTQQLVVGACWVGRTVDSAGNVLYARGGFDKFNCTSDNEWEFVDPANSATTYKCCQSGDGCNDEIVLDGVAGASAISFSLALLFASILAALRLF